MRRQEEPRTSRDAGPYLAREGYSRAGGGWRFDDAAPGTLDSALCTLNSVLYAESHSGRADRPRSAGGWEECHEVSGSGSGPGETMQSGQEKSTGSSAGSSTESSAGSRGDRKRRGPAGTPVPTWRHGGRGLAVSGWRCASCPRALVPSCPRTLHPPASPPLLLESC